MAALLALALLGIGAAAPWRSPAVLAAGPTVVCGSLVGPTVTWNAAGSPYNICAGGVTVPKGVTLTIDGAGAPVVVNATGAGGISVVGGTLQTANTTAVNTVTFAGPTTTPGSWNGINFTPDGPTSTKATGSLAYAIISSASYAFQTSGSSGLTLDNVTIDRSSADAINAYQTPLTVTNSTITRSGSHGIYAYNGALTVTGTHILTSNNQAIYGSGLTGLTVTVTGNTIDDTTAPNTYTGAGYAGIELDATTVLTLTNNTVTGTGGGPSATIPYAAIWLYGFTGDIGAQSGNQGNNNGLDMIAFHGTVTASFSWVTPTNSASVHPLGLFVDGALTVTAPGAATAPAFTIHAGDIVKVGLYGNIIMTGATFTGSDPAAGTRVLTSVLDNGADAGLRMCPSQFASSCPASIPTYQYWYGITLQADANARQSSGTLINGVVRFASTAFSITGSTPTTTNSLVVSNSTLGPTGGDAISSSYAPVTVTNSTITMAGGRGINVYNAALTVTGTHILQSAYQAIYATTLSGRTVTVTGNTIDDTVAGTPTTYTGAGYAGIELDGTTALTLTGNTVTGTGGGPAAATPYAAIWLNGFTGDIGAQSGNQGNNNGLDLVAFHGTVNASFSWVTPTNNATVHPLGDFLDGTVTVTAPSAGTAPVFTVHAGDIVKVSSYGGITLSGATFTGSDPAAGTRVLTSVLDNASDAGLRMCPSQFATSCPNPFPTYSYWYGITLQADTNARQSSGTLTNGVVRFASTAFSITGSTPTTTNSLQVSNSTLGPTSGDAISSSYAPVTVTNSTIVKAGSHGINVSSAALTVTGTHVLQSAYQAIYATSLAGQVVTVTGNTVDNTVAANTYTGAGYAGIELDNTTALTLTGNTVTGTGGGPAAATPYAAIWLNGFTGDIGAQSGNQGNNNGLDLLAFHGTVTASFSWVTPTNSATVHALGDFLDSSLTLSAASTLATPPTLTVHAGDVVKLASGGITVNGGALDASDPAVGAKIFTSARNNSVGMKACPSQFTSDCPTPILTYEYWTGITLQADAQLNKGNANVVNGAFSFASTPLSISSGATSTVGALPFGLAVAGSTFTNVNQQAIYATSTPISVVGTTIDTAGSDGILVSSANGNVFTGDVIQSVTGNGINLSSAGASISKTRITAAGGTSASYSAITNYNATTTIDCSSLHDNAGGVNAGGAGTTVHNSDLLHNTGANRFDLYATGATNAQANWWGQAAGPLTGQIGGPGPVDSSGFFTSQTPVAVITVAGTNTNANGTLGKGTMTVSVVFNRKMDTTVAPTVTFNPGGHTVTNGSWQSDSRTWQGTYPLNDTTASSGQNTVSVSGAISCVPESATNQMAATTQTFMVDYSTPTAITNDATGVARDHATLNGTVNPNGWATTGYFQLGTTSGTYTTTTATQTLGNGTTPAAVTQNVSSLTPFTTYYYQFVADNGNGKSYGAEKSFVTPSLLYFPALMNNAYGGYTTTVYLQNKSGAAQSAGAVTITYYDQNGTVVGVGDASPALPDGAVWVIPQNNGHSFSSGGAGSGRVNTTVPLVAFVNQEKAGGDGSSYSALPETATGSTVYAPAVLNGAYGGYTTGMGITNTGGTATTVTVTYHRADGTAVTPSRTQSLASNAYWGLYQGENATPLSAGFAGTATITSNPSVPLAVIVNEAATTGQFLTYTASNSGGRTLYAPAIFNNAYGGYNTGLGIQNIGTGTASITIDYTGTVGSGTTSATYSKTLTITAGGYSPEYTGGGAANGTLPDQFHGSATIASDQPLVVIVNEVQTGASYGTSYNAFPAGIPTVHLPLVENNLNGFSTGLGIQNVGSGSATVTIDYTDPNTGAVIGHGPTLTLLPGAFAGVYEGPGGDGGIPTGTRAAATIAVTNPVAGGKLAVIVNQQSPSSFMSYSGQ